MSSPKPRPIEIPGLLITYDFAFGENGERTFHFQTAVDQTISEKDLDELLDRVMSSLDRQKAKLDVEKLKRTIDRGTREVEHEKRDYQLAETRIGGEGGGRGSPSKMQREELSRRQRTVENMSLQLKDAASDLRAREQLINRGGNGECP